MPTLRRSALIALFSISAIAVILVVASQRDTNVKATQYGLGPIPSSLLPLPGLDIGVNLCDATFTWTQTAGGPDTEHGGATSGFVEDYTGDCETNATNAPGANPDYISPFHIDDPSSNFASIVSFSPPESTIAPGPGHRDPADGAYPDIASVDFSAATHPDLGSIIGTVSSDPVTLSLKIGAGVSNCNQNVTVEFAMMNATVDFLNSAGTAVDPAKVIAPKTPLVALGEGNPLQPLAQDNDADGLPDHVNKYTSYMLDLFDPDKLNPELTDSETNTTYPAVDGPLLPLQPRARYVGRALVAGSDQILEFLVFEKGQLAAMGALKNHPFAELGTFRGYPSVTVLNDPTVPAAPSTIQDFCTALGTTTVLMGNAITNAGLREAVYRDTGSVPNAVDATDTLLVGTAAANGTPLVAFIANEQHVDSGGTPNVYDVGEAIYRDVVLPANQVDSGDIRLFGTAAANGTALVAFAADEKHVDSGAQANVYEACADAGTDTLSCLNNPVHGAAEDARYTSALANTGLLGTNQHFFIDITQSQRDADNDGWENDIDTCPFNDNSLTGANPWNPHESTPGDDDGDGIPLPCDPDDSFVPPEPSTAISNQDEKNAGGNPDILPPVGSDFTCASCVLSATNNTVTVTPDPGWVVNSKSKKVVSHLTGGTKTILSNTSNTLTIASNWTSNPVSGRLDIFADTFYNRQDNCPLILNQSQFQLELVSTLPEDGGQRSDTIGDACETADATGTGHWHIDQNLYPKCISATQATADADGDGWCDTLETTLGSVSTGTAADGRAAALSTPEHVYLDVRYNLARQAQSINHAQGGRPNVSQCRAGSVVCTLTAHIPAGTASDPYPHPDTGEPVGNVPLFCNDGVDNDGDGTGTGNTNVDRQDSGCKIGTAFATLTTAMKTDLNAIMPDQDGDDDGTGIGRTWQEVIRGSDPVENCAANTTPNNELLDPWVFDLDDSATVSGGDVFKIFPEWLRNEASNNFTYRADIDGNGTISGGDVFAVFPKWLQTAPGC